MYKRTTYSIFSFDWLYISDLMTYVEREWWLSILLSAFAKRCLFISVSHYFVWISWWNYRYQLLPLKIGSEYQNLHGNSWVLLCVIMDGFLDYQRLTIIGFFLLIYSLFYIAQQLFDEMSQHYMVLNWVSYTVREIKQELNFWLC